jgi:pimeloyl-ACP methyl ester carboxylesterase
MRHILILLLSTVVLNFWSPAYSNDTRVAEFPTYTALANGISIAYQDFGDADDEVVLLVMGLGAQLITWDDQIVHSLVAEGYRVIRFDNRDAGWSEKFYHAPNPGWTTGLRYKLGMELNPPYQLEDMADDAHALLSFLNIQRAHVVGASMGGMIAQIMTAKYPETVMSLTSIMSTSGADHLPQGSVQPSLGSSAVTRDEKIQEMVDFVKQFGGTVGTLTDEQWYSRIARSYDRSHYGPGTARQMWAIAGSGDRVELLKTISQPTVVIHGADDKLIPYQGGEHTASLIENSKFVLLDSMGHRIDSHNRTQIIAEILEVIDRTKLNKL